MKLKTNKRVHTHLGGVHCNYFLRGILFLMLMGLSVFAFRCIDSKALCGGNENLDPANGCIPIDNVPSLPTPDGEQCPSLEYTREARDDGGATFVASITRLCQLLEDRLAGGFDETSRTHYEYRLEKDLDFSKVVDFLPLGMSPNIDSTPKQFRGTFDGRGKKIIGLKINQRNRNSVGFFSHIDRGGTVKDLIFVKPQIRGRGKVGTVVGENAGRVENVSVLGAFVVGTGSVENYEIAVKGEHFPLPNSRIGGLVGFNNGGEVRGCRLENLDDETSKIVGISRVGGLVGHSLNGRVTLSCPVSTNDPVCSGREEPEPQALEDSLPDVSAASESDDPATDPPASGSDAPEEEEEGYIANFSQGEILARVEGVGGIVGAISGENKGNGVSRAAVFGSITRAIVKQAECQDEEGINYLGCKILGLAELACDVLSLDCATKSKLSQVGGIVGHLAGGLAVSSSHTLAGSYVAGKLKIGGVVGYSEGVIENSGSKSDDGCDYEVDSANIGTVCVRVEGSEAVGGLVGEKKGESANNRGIIKSYSKTLVRASVSSAGGLIGKLQQSIVTGSYAEGAVIAPEAKNVGGLVGHAFGEANLKGVYASAKVSGNKRVGGLVGYAGSKEQEISACGGEGATTVTSDAENNGETDSAGTTAGIVDSYVSDTIVSGAEQVGGLVGCLESSSGGNQQQASTIGNSYADAIIKRKDGASNSDLSSVGGLLGFKGQRAFIENSYSVSRLELGDIDLSSALSIATVIGKCGEGSSDTYIIGKLYGLASEQRALGFSCSTLSTKTFRRSLTYLRDVLIENGGLGWTNNYWGGQLGTANNYPCLKNMALGATACNTGNTGVASVVVCDGNSERSSMNPFAQLMCRFGINDTPNTDRTTKLTLKYTNDDGPHLTPTYYPNPDAPGSASPKIRDEDVFFKLESLTEKSGASGLDEESLTERYGLSYELTWQKNCRKASESASSCDVVPEPNNCPLRPSTEGTAPALKTELYPSSSISGYISLQTDSLCDRSSDGNNCAEGPYCFYLRACNDYEKCTAYSDPVAITYKPYPAVENARLEGRTEPDIRDIQYELKWERSKEDKEISEGGEFLYRVERRAMRSDGSTTAWDVCSHSSNEEATNLSCCGRDRDGRKTATYHSTKDELLPILTTRSSYTYTCPIALSNQEVQDSNGDPIYYEYRVLRCAEATDCTVPTIVSDLPPPSPFDAAITRSAGSSVMSGKYLSARSDKRITKYGKIPHILSWRPSQMAETSYWSGPDSASYELKYELQTKRIPYSQRHSISYTDLPWKWGEGDVNQDGAIDELDNDLHIEYRYYTPYTTAHAAAENLSYQTDWQWGDSYFYRIRLCAYTREFPDRSSCSPWVSNSGFGWSFSEKPPQTGTRNGNVSGLISKKGDATENLLEIEWYASNVLAYRFQWSNNEEDASSGRTRSGHYFVHDCGAEDAGEASAGTQGVIVENSHLLASYSRCPDDRIPTNRDEEGEDDEETISNSCAFRDMCQPLGSRLRCRYKFRGEISDPPALDEGRTGDGFHPAASRPVDWLVDTPTPYTYTFTMKTCYDHTKEDSCTDNNIHLKHSRNQNEYSYDIEVAYTEDDANNADIDKDGWPDAKEHECCTPAIYSAKAGFQAPEDWKRRDDTIPPLTPLDTDGDGTCDYTDADDDGDGHDDFGPNGIDERGEDKIAGTVDDLIGSDDDKCSPSPKSQKAVAILWDSKQGWVNDDGNLPTDHSIIYPDTYEGYEEIPKSSRIPYWDKVKNGDLDEGENGDIRILDYDRDGCLDEDLIDKRDFTPIPDRITLRIPVNASGSSEERTFIAATSPPGCATADEDPCIHIHPDGGLLAPITFTIPNKDHTEENPSLRTVILRAEDDDDDNDGYKDFGPDGANDFGLDGKLDASDLHVDDSASKTDDQCPRGTMGGTKEQGERVAWKSDQGWSYYREALNKPTGDTVTPEEKELQRTDGQELRSAPDSIGWKYYWNPKYIIETRLVPPVDIIKKNGIIPVNKEKTPILDYDRDGCLDEDTRVITAKTLSRINSVNDLTGVYTLIIDPNKEEDTIANVSITAEDPDDDNDGWSDVDEGRCHPVSPSRPGWELTGRTSDTKNASEVPLDTDGANPDKNADGSEVTGDDPRLCDTQDPDDDNDGVLDCGTDEMNKDEKGNRDDKDCSTTRNEPNNLNRIDFGDEGPPYLPDNDLRTDDDLCPKGVIRMVGLNNWHTGYKTHLKYHKEDKTYDVTQNGVVDAGSRERVDENGDGVEDGESTDKDGDGCLDENIHIITAHDESDAKDEIHKLPEGAAYVVVIDTDEYRDGEPATEVRGAEDPDDDNDSVADAAEHKKEKVELDANGDPVLDAGEEIPILDANGDPVMVIACNDPLNHVKNWISVTPAEYDAMRQQQTNDDTNAPKTKADDLGVTKATDNDGDGCRDEAICIITAHNDAAANGATCPEGATRITNIDGSLSEGSAASVVIYGAEDDDDDNDGWDDTVEKECAVAGEVLPVKGPQEKKDCGDDGDELCRSDPLDASSQPLDTDGDKTCDTEDDDDDNDTVLDADDKCKDVFNPDTDTNVVEADRELANWISITPDKYDELDTDVSEMTTDKKHELKQRYKIAAGSSSNENLQTHLNSLMARYGLTGTGNHNRASDYDGDGCLDDDITITLKMAGETTKEVVLTAQDDDDDNDGHKDLGENGRSDLGEDGVVNLPDDSGTPIAAENADDPNPDDDRCPRGRIGWNSKQGWEWVASASNAEEGEGEDGGEDGEVIQPAAELVLKDILINSRGIPVNVKANGTIILDFDRDGCLDREVDKIITAASLSAVWSSDDDSPPSLPTGVNLNDVYTITIDPSVSSTTVADPPSESSYKNLTAEDDDDDNDCWSDTDEAACKSSPFDSSKRPIDIEFDADQDGACDAQDTDDDNDGVPDDGANRIFGDADDDIDDDNDGLIEIHNLSMLGNVQYDLHGSSYDEDKSDNANDPSGCIKSVSTKPLARDSDGNVYVADTTNHCIHKITSAGVKTTFAGTCGTSGHANHNTDATQASFNAPEGLAVDSDGNVYVGDTGNHVIRRIAAGATVGGAVTTLAGSRGVAGQTDGVGTHAQLCHPMGVAINNAGTELYVADRNNHRIRKITIPGGVVTTLAGNGACGGGSYHRDGTGTAARFYFPTDIAINSAGTELYVADRTNHRIRKITIPAGVVTTLGGKRNKWPA